MISLLSLLFVRQVDWFWWSTLGLGILLMIVGWGVLYEWYKTLER
jgi:hypothetical protein